MTRIPRKLAAAAAAALMLVSFAAMACSDDDDDSGKTPPAGATSAATSAATSSADKIDISGVDELSDGSLGIGSDIAYAPMEFLDEATNEPTGFTIDLANAIGDLLGVEVAFENGLFDGLLPALEAQRHHLNMSSMTASDEPKQQVDFVEYFIAGSGIIVPAGNPEGINGPDDLCGKTVAAQEGTVQIDFLIGTTEAPGGLDQKCKDDGNEGITVLRGATDPDAVQFLVAGQADAEMADFPVAAYSAQLSNGALEIVPNQIEAAPYGIAVRKSSTALRDVLQAAFDELVATGVYLELLENWNLEDGKLP